MSKSSKLVLRLRLAANVKAQRTALGWSQEALAEAAELSQVYISNIELAKVAASVDVVEKLSLAFKLDPGALVSEASVIASHGRHSIARSR